MKQSCLIPQPMYSNHQGEYQAINMPTTYHRDQFLDLSTNLQHLEIDSSSQMCCSLPYISNLEVS